MFSLNDNFVNMWKLLTAPTMNCSDTAKVFLVKLFSSDELIFSGLQSLIIVSTGLCYGNSIPKVKSSSYAPEKFLCRLAINFHISLPPHRHIRSSPRAGWQWRSNRVETFWLLFIICYRTSDEVRLKCCSQTSAIDRWSLSRRKGRIKWRTTRFKVKTLNGNLITIKTNFGNLFRFRPSFWSDWIRMHKLKCQSSWATAQPTFDEQLQSATGGIAANTKF